MIWLGLLLLLVVAVAVDESERPRLTVLDPGYWAGVERQDARGGV